MNWGELSGGVVQAAIVANYDFIQTLPNPGDWIELPYGVGVGWSWDGANWTGPSGESPPVEPTPPENYILDGWQWVSRFTDAEWQFIKSHRSDGTAAGDALDKMLDAIRWTNSVDVSSENMDPFYNWLLNNGLPGGQTRIDELRAGVSF